MILGKALLVNTLKECCCLWVTESNPPNFFSAYYMTNIHLGDMEEAWLKDRKKSQIQL